MALWDHLYINTERSFDEPILLKASIVHGFKRGSKDLGFPTANLNMNELGERGEQLETGIYFGWILLKDTVYETVVSVGYNPVYKNETKTVEAYIINQILPDFYGEPVQLLLLGYLRQECNFNGLDELIQCINTDVEHSMKQLIKTKDKYSNMQQWSQEK